MTKQIDKVAAELNKQLGSVQVVRAKDAFGLGYRRISTRILGLDIVCGANSPSEWGIPTGRVTEFWGMESSGKTTVALNCIVSAQEKGFCGAFVSLENAWDNKWARRIGIDTQRLLVARVSSSEDAESVIYTLAQTPGVGVIVVDSVAMLTSMSELNTDTREKNVQPGTQAKAVNRIMRHISAGFNAWPIDDIKSVDQQPAIILLNQVREKIGAYGDPQYSPGGKGKDHQCSVRIRMSRGEVHHSKKSDKKSPVYAVTLKAMSVKNKTWPQHQTVEYMLYIRDAKRGDKEYQMGTIDEVDQLLWLGRRYGLVEQRGSIFEYDQITGKGANDFCNQLADFDAGQEQLQADILEAAWNQKGL